MLFAKYHGHLCAHPSRREVSLCDLSSNFGAQRLRSWSAHFRVMPRDRPFLSRICRWCQIASGEFDLVSVPNFPRSRWKDFLGWENLRYTTQLYRLPSVKQLILLHHFSSNLLNWPSAPLCLNTPEFASRFRLAIFDIREDANNDMTDWYKFLWRFFTRFRGVSSVKLCLRSWSKRRRLCSLSTSTSVAKTANSPPLEHCPFALYLQLTFSHSPVHADILPSSTFDSLRRLFGNCRRSPKQSVFLVEFRRIFQHSVPRH